jgi:hypothetical protein
VVNDGTARRDVSLRLNLGCGRTTNEEFVNIDFNFFLRLGRIPGVKSILTRFGISYPNLDQVMIHDLRKGIPFAAETVDIVYHSHLLEHIDYEQVNMFLEEIQRVLKVGGIQRLVIPDLELHILQIQKDIRIYEESGFYNGAALNIHNLLEQSVRKKPAAILQLSPIFQRIAIWLFGDAQSRGETHQMMYTRAAVHEILEKNGFVNITFLSPEVSQIPNWNLMNLDLSPTGLELHKGSVYVECQKN